jgi:hypothetical protein
VPGQWRKAAEELGEEDESEEEMEEPYGAGSESLLDFMRGFGHMKANDSGWPTFDGQYASYPRFKEEWKAYRETYHSAVNNDLATKALRDKCIQGEGQVHPGGCTQDGEPPRRPAGDLGDSRHLL